MTGDTTPSKRRFAVLDRDGTIIVDQPYSADPARMELIPGASEGLQTMREAGLGLVVVTNQSGVGRGLFPEQALEPMHRRLRDLLGAAGVSLDGIYWCPHHPDDGCDCRKPGTALIERAARELDFDPGAAFVIGDKDSDVALGHRVGATTFLVRRAADSSAGVESALTPDHVVDDLPAAAAIIECVLAAEASREPGQR